jgi:hypothetical protein
VRVGLKSTGHFIPEERPDELTNVIESFLAGSPVPATWSPSDTRP